MGNKNQTATTLVDVLRQRAVEQEDDRLFTFLAGGEEEESRLTFGELDRRARALATVLRGRQLEGERAVLLFPPGLEFIAAFMGCLYAGVVAVPVYPPRRNRPDPRLAAILEDCTPALALTTAAVSQRWDALLSHNPRLQGVDPLAVDQVPEGEAEKWQPPPIDALTLAFLQYTSGSTSTPKGVRVRHGNLLHNEEMIRRAFGHSAEPGERPTITGWLPLFHDMGLIGNVLQPLYLGAHCIMMSPLAFLQRPARWLRAISRYRAHTSGGPNFAYDLCVQRVTEEVKESLDLSSWRVAFNGSEPVRAETLDRFAEAFAGCGFEPSAFFPCYGLAEGTLFVSGAVPGGGMVVESFDDKALERNEAVASPAGRRLVSSGRLGMDVELHIVDPESVEPPKALVCPPGGVGEIWVRSPSNADGYWQRTEATQETFGATLEGGDAPFMRTGDLGFVRHGELFVTGRLKDLIILRGRNLYPQDVEETVEACHPAVRAAGTACFALEVASEERLVVVAEIGHRDVEVAEEVIVAVQRAVAETYEAQVFDVVLVRAGTVPKTSSGKIRRQATKAQYQKETLKVVRRGREEAVEPPAETLVASSSRDTLLALGGEERRSTLFRYLAGQVAELARLPLARVVEQGAAETSLVALGLDSLGAVELVHRLDADLGMQLPLEDLLEGQSLHQIAHRAAQELGRTTAEEDLAPPLPGRHPVSHGQRGLWFLERLARHGGAYHILAAARVEGGLDVSALGRALAHLSLRHDALRTTFEAVDGEPWLHLHALPRVDFRCVAVPELDDAALERRLADEGYEPFELASDPLLRVRVYERPGRRPVVLLAIHHLVADFWSLTVMVRELGLLYSAEIGEAKALLEPHPGSFVASVARHNKALEGAFGERLWEVWRRRLGGPLPVLDLPLDRPRRGRRHGHGSWQTLDLAADLLRGAEVLAREQGTTLFAVLLGVFQVLLARSAGQDEVLVGAPASGRGDAALRSLVGYCVNPVVLRGDLADRPSFATFLGRLRQVVREALIHQGMPFPLLAERLRPEGAPAHAPLFQVMFVLQQAQRSADEALSAFALKRPGARLQVGPLHLEALPVELRFAQFDMTLMAAQVDGDLVLGMEYDKALFDRTTIRRFLGHYRQLLTSILEDAERSVGALPLLAPVERHQVLAEWAGAVRPAPAEECLHQLFEAQAARTPEATALLDGEEQLPYGELEARANRLARWLAECGARPEEKVAICLPRGFDLVVGLLAVLKTGAAYVPLDPAYPQERLQFTMADAGVRLVLTVQRFADLLAMPSGEAAAGPAPQVIYLDTEAERLALHDATPPACTVGQGHLAYVIYTSGSTGRPKGVAIEHRSAVALLAWSGEAFDDDEMAVVMAATSVCFDLSVFEIFAPLARGGAVALARDALALPQLAVADRVTLVNTVPSAMAELVAGGDLPATVRTVNLAGEALPEELVEDLFSSTHVRTVWNLYGPSEDTTYSTFLRIARRGAGVPTIGRPLLGSRAYVFDGALRPLAAGVAGELCLAGAGLARGYLGRPARTAAAFVPNPFSSTVGDRLYRTGDRVRFRGDGELVFLGRFDQQVKVRGFRIELGEVERALVAQAAVSEAAVMALPSAAGDLRLVAWVAPAGLSAEVLRSALAQRLPEFMVPAVLVAVDALPRTANGKLDRKALPAPDGGREAARVAPRTPLEELVAGVWCDLLGLDKVGVRTDFFSLGGHSLLATRLVSRLRDVLGVEVPLNQVFEASTVERQAALVNALGSGDQNALGEVMPEVIPTADRDRPLLLSPAQTRLWFLYLLDPGSAAYNMSAMVRLRGPLVVAALDQALAQIEARHEILRTRFRVAGGQVEQVVEGPGFHRLPVVDVEHLVEERRAADALNLGAALARRPFALEARPPWLAVLLRLAEGDHVLVLSMHHIVADEWSVAVLTRELGSLYEAALRGLRAPLPALAVQYADYAQWQREFLSGERLNDLLSHWRERLSGAPDVLELPTSRPRPAQPSSRGGILRRPLPGALVTAVRGLSRQANTTLFMTLLAGFQSLLARLSGQSDLLVGVPVAHRTRSELEALLGFFVNTLVLRAELTGLASFHALLEQVRRRTLDAYAHQDVPFEKLVEALRPERQRQNASLVQVIFQLIGQLGAVPHRLGELDMEHWPVGEDHAKFDLVLNVEESSAGLAAAWRYRSELFDRTDIERFARSYERLLGAVVANPACSPWSLPLLSDAQQHQLRHEWNPTSTARPSPSLAGVPNLAAAFIARATETPDEIALVDTDVRLTWGDLDRRSSELARRLRKRGVGPETLVGVSLERSWRLVVAILGVLRAGGGYLPLDPDYPADRLSFVLEDAQAPLVLTEAELVDRFVDGPAEPLVVDDLESTPSAGPLPALEVGPDHLAYVIYTSGSTGRPKGVPVTHGNVLRLLEQTEPWFGFSRQDTWTLFHSCAFDFSVWELWGALAYGGRLVVVPYWVSRSPQDFLQLLIREQVTVLNQTPSAFRQLVAAEETSGAHAHRELALRWVIFGGEALDLPSLGPWMKRHGAERPRLINMYGITETTVHVTYRQVLAEDLESAHRSPIGVPIPDLQVHLFDRRGRLVPVGVVGEMQVGGGGVARGYLRRPALTAQRFVPDPVGQVPGGRLYRSGDLARRTPQGALEYLGRLDHQVKVRGFRIELGEIEAVLDRHPRLQQAVVMARSDGGREARLVAYVVCAEASAWNEAAEVLRGWVGERLPDHMVPSVFVVLEALPMLPSGKLDRKSLPAPAETFSQQVDEAPEEPLEVWLGGHWAAVLEVPAVGRHSDFFELGGNSIAAAMLVNRLQGELAEIIHVVLVFDAPTVAQMAEGLRREYPAAVAAVLGEELQGDGEVVDRRVDAARVAALRAFVEPLAPFPEGGRKNPSAVFVLSPPRSGSTLMRVMLGGHPQLFAPPELELLSFNTLAERRDAFTGRDSFWLEGAVRAVMAAREVDADEATAIVAAATAEGMSTRRFYGQLQEWIGERKLVDKTPSYALDPAILARAEANFEGALYVHLTRHPYGMIRSFEAARLEQIFFRHNHPFDRRELAELLWLVSLQNITQFLQGIPAQRQHLVRFEDLVRQPEEELGKLCVFLDIEYRPEMTEPYTDTSADRMTDGIHQVSRMLGDVKFHQHRRVDPTVAERWRESVERDFLGDPTWRMAETLGYQQADLERAAPPRSVWTPMVTAVEPSPAPLSFAQERLWFLDRMDPGNPAYNLVAGFVLEGPLNLPLLSASLGAIVTRHQALRTRFREEGGALQEVDPARPQALPQVDLEGLPADRRWAEAERLLGAEAERGFDLAHGPLLRLTAVRLEATRQVVLFNLHHIAGDGWSVGVILRELRELYGAALAGRQAQLPRLPVQYTDYARWQRAWLDGEVLGLKLDHWRQTLAGLEPLELPVDRVRPAQQSLRGATLKVRLPADLSRSLAELGRRRGSTVFMTLAATLRVVLGRAAGQVDFALGTPVAGRTRAEVEALVGFFVNTLVLRVDLRSNPTVMELLERERQAALEAFAHQEVPFEKLVAELAQDRDPSRMPLCQVMFALENASRERLELPGLESRQLEVSTGTSKFDLSLSLRETEEGLAGTLEYRTDLFDSTTMQRLWRSYAALLEGVVENPGRRIAELPWLDAAERHQTLFEWPPFAPGSQGGVGGLEVEEPLPLALERQAQRRPEAIALCSTTGATSWAALSVAATGLANHLRARGVQRGDRVGLLLTAPRDVVLAIWAVWKAGGAYLYLDAGHPSQRLAALAADSGLRVVLTNQEGDELAGGLGVAVLAFTALQVAADARAEPPPPTAQDLAYLIYTSGSTGRPKAVMVEHRQLSHTLAAVRRRFVLEATDVMSSMAPFSFDISLFEVFASLLAGGSCRLFSRDEVLDLPRLLPALERTTQLHAVPALLRQIVDAAGAERVRCPGLRRVYVGGDRVPADLPERAVQAFPKAAVTVLYGPTEATILATALALEDPSEVTGAPIGWPLPGVRAQVMDPQGRVQPVGIPGELWLGGPGISRGYLGRPGQTACQFVPADEGRFYRTGDRVRRQAAGGLEFLGRIDQQVKVRGFRIEPDEVAAVAAEHPEVEEAVVVVQKDGVWEGLVAYLTGGAQTEAVQGFLAERLPEYMVPAFFVALETLPLSPNGKVDRRALPVPAGLRTELVQPYVAPETETEELLAEQWGEVLGVERVGVKDNFFNLGGHSLLATQLVSRVREIFDVEVPLKQFFEGPTVAQLAETIETLLIEQIISLGDEEAALLLEAEDDLLGDA